MSFTRTPEIPILFQNDDLLVINKPAGLPVHSGTGGGITLEDYMSQFQLGKKEPPHLAHRLDRDTSGCLILGRTKQALRTLGKLFEHKRIQKTYWAILQGTLPQKQMRIDAPLAKITALKTRWHMKVDPEGQQAITELRVLGEQDGLTWVELKPKTGRTHQLRVHCAHIGAPIMGDSLYGTGTADTPLMLHARALRIPYTHGDAPLWVEAPPSRAMLDVMKSLNFSL